jgi:hypothetical protein
MNTVTVTRFLLLATLLAASNTFAAGYKVTGLPATEVHCDEAGLSWYYTANWKPLPYPNAATPWQKYHVAVKNCAQPVASAVTCTPTVCSIKITGCLVRVTWSKVTVIASGLPVKASYEEIPAGTRPGRCQTK